MRNILITTLCLMISAACWAAPLRVITMDFDDQTGMTSDARLGGTMQAGTLAQKGAFLLTKELLGTDGIVLIDRRDFLAQIAKLRPQDGGAPTPTKPSFLQAAQTLNADMVLRGSLLSFSTGKQVVNQGGYQAEFTKVSLRVAIEALDAIDGTVVAMAEEGSSDKFRQTASVQTVMSEDDILELFRTAIRQAVPGLVADLKERAEAREAQPKIKLSIITDADPAMLEIDGMLVGSTPVENLEIYQGDHVLTVGKPGYQDVTKRILFKKDVQMEVPMIRTQLTASEMKEVMEKMRMSVIVGEPSMIIHEISE